MHIRVLLSILPLVASAAAEAAPYNFVVSQLNARSLGLHRRQPQSSQSCPPNTLSCGSINDGCCPVGERCGALGCCPIGLDCSLPSTCTARSDPNCASKADCCPADLPFCNRTRTGAAVCQSFEAGSGGGDDGEEAPPVVSTDTPSSTTTSTSTSPPTEDDSVESTTTSVSPTTFTTSAEDTLTFPTFPNTTVPTPISNAVTILPSSTVTGTSIGDGEPPIQDGNGGARRSVDMSVLMGLGVVVGAAVML